MRNIVVMIKQLLFIHLIILLSSFDIQGRDPSPMNGQFNIGQDTITSYQYGIYSIDNSYLSKADGTTITLDHNLAYGISRHSGCELNIPFFLYQKSNGRISKGLSDMQALFQWHPYRTDEHLLALKAGIQFPTGDTTANPPLGLGSFMPIFNFDAFHASENWFASFIISATIGTTRKHRNPGTFIEYSVTFGRRYQLGTPDEAEWLFFWELDGLYSSSAKFQGKQVANTGGHLILLGPIVSYDTDRDQYLLRIQVPIADRRFGIQPKTKFFATLIYQHDI